jgi:hypothetical protein
VKVSEFITTLKAKPGLMVIIRLPSGEFVPSHFHITEIGISTKLFIDCGGDCHDTAAGVMQVWVANDVDHRLTTDKLVKIADFKPHTSYNLAELDLEVEYQLDPTESVSTYTVSHVWTNKTEFMIVLGIKSTNCLAPDKCGVSDCC